MIRAFPASADRVADVSLDGGRVRPSFVMGSENVQRLLRRNPGFVVLTRDPAHVEELTTEPACREIAKRGVGPGAAERQYCGQRTHRVAQASTCGGLPYFPFISAFV